MTPRIPIRAGVTWTSDDEPLEALLGGAAAPVRLRAERADRLSAVALGITARLGLVPAAAGIRRDVGVSVGTALGCFATNAAFQRRFVAPGGTASPRLFAGTVSNAAAGEVGIAYGLGGPGVTVTAGGAGGLAALDVARAELIAGEVDGIVVAALDVVDDAARRWLGEAGWPADSPALQAVAMALGEAPAELPVTGWLGCVTLGRWDAAAPEAIGRVAHGALADAGLRLSDVRVRVGRSGDVPRVREALSCPPGAIGARAGAPLLAAGGPAALLEGLVRGTEPVLVVDVCPSGHVAAAVAWRRSA